MQQIADDKSSAQHGQRPDGQALRILLIGSDAAPVGLVRDALEASDRVAPDVARFLDLPGAFDILEARQFDAVVLAVAANDTSFAGSVAALHVSSPQVPAIVVFDEDDPGLAAQALQAGAQDSLTAGELTPRLLERSLLSAIERSRSANESRYAEQRFRGLFEQSPIPIAVFAPDGRWLYFNQALRERYDGWARHLDTYNALHDEQIAGAGMLPYVRRAFEGEAVRVPLMSFVSSTRGVTYWVKAFVFPVKDDAGAVREVVSVFEDITEQKAIEDNLRAKEAQYRGIFEATTDGLIINAMDGTVVEVNPAFCEMHGYTRDEVVGVSPTIFIHPDYQKVMSEYVATIAAGGEYRRQAVDVRKDGTPFHVEVHASAFTYNGQPHILGVVRDVSDRAQAYELLEQRVAERTRELATLLEVSQNVASTLELEPLLSGVLVQLRSVVEYCQASIQMRDGDSLISMGASISPPRGEGAALTPLPPDRLGVIWDALAKGQPVIVPDVQADTVMAAALREGAGESLESGATPVRSWLAVPLTLRDGALGMLSLASDEADAYSARHARLATAIANQAAVAIDNARLYSRAQETASLTAAAEERQRLARELHDSVSQAIFSISLQTRTALNLAKRDPARVEEPLKHIAALAQAAMAEMRALIFELRPESISTEGLVPALTKYAAALAARHGIEVQTHLGEEPHLSIEAKEVAYRVAQEACHNVIKHAAASHLQIELREEGGWVVLEVSDNGRGFDTERQYPGHLGLKSMRERAHQHAGTLDIESAPGTGTLVRLRVRGASQGS
jgi:PAS domain S-box-containing protein